MAYTEEDIRNLIRNPRAFKSFDGKILTRVIGIDTVNQTVTIGGGERISAEEFFVNFYEA